MLAMYDASFDAKLNYAKRNLMGKSLIATVICDFEKEGQTENELGF